MKIILKKDNNYAIRFNKIKIFINQKYYDMFDFNKNDKIIKCNLGDKIHLKVNKFKTNEIEIDNDIKYIAVSSAINNQFFLLAYICFFGGLIFSLTNIITNIYFLLSTLIPLALLVVFKIFKKDRYLNATKGY